MNNIILLINNFSEAYKPINNIYIKKPINYSEELEKLNYNYNMLFNLAHRNNNIKQIKKLEYEYQNKIRNLKYKCPKLPIISE